MPLKLVRQYSVFLPNIPGALSRFIELFTEAGINIIGIASEIRDDSGIVRITADTDSRIGYILTNAGFTTVETLMISVELPNKPGELLKLTRLLAEQNINITTIYGTSDSGKASRLLLNVPDVKRVFDVLKNAVGTN